jgi:hypothetical protein
VCSPEEAGVLQFMFHSAMNFPPLVPLDLKLVFLWVGCVYSNAGSRSQKHRNFSLLEGSTVETHCTSATEGYGSTQTHE